MEDRGQEREDSRVSDLERAQRRKLLRQVAELEHWRMALERRVDYLERVRERLEEAVNAAPVGLIGTDSLGVVQLWNRGAEVLLGYPARRLVGKNMALLDGEVAPALRAALGRVLRGERVGGLDLRRGAGKGLQLRLRLSGRPVISAAGVLRGAILVVGARGQQAAAPAEGPATGCPASGSR